MNEERKAEEQPAKNWKEKLGQYKIHLSVATAVLAVGMSALVHYKNERIKDEMIKTIGEYQKGLLLVGGEIDYDSLDCSGILSTSCKIEGIRLSVMGQEQLSIKSLRLGNVEELGALKGFIEGGDTEVNVDIEIDEIALPQPLIAALVAKNVSSAFQQNATEKLGTLNLVLKAQIEGSPGLIKNLVIERLWIDNAIMPIEFSMEASDISSGMPDSMVLRKFSLGAEDRAISDVTYESISSLYTQLPPGERGHFLKEFGLKSSDMNDKAKASSAIKNTIAKRFETDLAMTQGSVEKELIRAMIAVLKGEADEITLKGENKGQYTMLQVQNFLLQTAGMNEEEGKRFMEDKFVIEVESD